MVVNCLTKSLLALYHGGITRNLLTASCWDLTIFVKMLTNSSDYRKHAIQSVQSFWCRLRVLVFFPQHLVRAGMAVADRMLAGWLYRYM